jgi:hypothetical protein
MEPKLTFETKLGKGRFIMPQRSEIQGNLEVEAADNFGWTLMHQAFTFFSTWLLLDIQTVYNKRVS